MSGAKQEIIIRLHNICNRFGAQEIHKDLSLDIYKGEIIGLVGGSGSGKSVLLRTIIGLNKPAEGSIGIFGEDVTQMTPKDLLDTQRRWGILFQSGALFSSLTVEENIQVPMREYTRMSEALMDELAALKVTMAGLPENAARKFPSELSGGMIKRVALARALALDPEILFLDEPTAGLDPIGAASFDQLIRTLRENLGLTVVMVTHDLDSLYAICDRVAVLIDKKIVVDTIDGLMKIDHPWIKEYFGGLRGRAAAKLG